MDGSLMALVVASATFVHFLLSHPARAALVARMGEKGFLGLYSLVALATFGWMLWAYSAVEPGIFYWAPNDLIWATASLLTLIAAILFVGSFRGNPALPDPDGDVIRTLAAKVPTGVFRVTRHPMMWGFALLGISHMLIAPRADVFIFVGSIVFMALVGAYAQDRKKEGTLGEAWTKWERKTSFVPRLSQFAKIEPRVLLIGTLFWLLATWGHSLLGYAGAGIYRWL